MLRQIFFPTSNLPLGCTTTHISGFLSLNFSAVRRRHCALMTTPPAKIKLSTTKEEDALMTSHVFKARTKKGFALYERSDTLTLIITPL